MPIILTNWKVNDRTKDIVAWVPQNDHRRIQSNRNIAKFHTGYSNKGKGVQNVNNSFYEYVLPFEKCKFDGRNMWSIKISGETFIIVFESRMQNPKYPIQSFEEVLVLLDR